ncbi:hypothetical protein, partial [Paraclostridium dentum]|uniref:hypothetical protein n=1 Tax=Paraclostridium dentum TaxID=2662455 RepID=UPI003F2DEBB0
LETIDDTAVKGTIEEIHNRIVERFNNCGYFWPFTNNCEHLSNYLRYGRTFSEQVCLFHTTFYSFLFFSWMD